MTEIAFIPDVKIDNSKKRIACIADSPKLTTGFGVVAKEIYKGFHDMGLEVHALGIMDSEPDINNELPYSFWPCSKFDDLGRQTLALFLTKIQPDILFILLDPGSVASYIRVIQSMMAIGSDNNRKPLKKFPIMVYTPLEGSPIPKAYADLFDTVARMGGKTILYSPGMIKKIKDEYNFLKNVDIRYAYHGSDHAQFERYPDDYRDHLRHICGFSDYYVIGSVGVNKRTKGFDTIIYTAQYINDASVKFYLHTAPSNPIMQGYLLHDLTERYKVNQKFLWKPEEDSDPGGNRNGIKRSGMDFSLVNRPDSINERYELFKQFSFIDRLNVLDLYLDLAQVEGWGLPPFEAMRCGVPTISINDNSIRKEIYDSGAILIEPTPDVCSTWHTGVQLPVINPKEVARTIEKIKADKKLQADLSIRGQITAAQYKWDATRNIMNEIAKELLKGATND